MILSVGGEIANLSLRIYISCRREGESKEMKQRIAALVSLEIRTMDADMIRISQDRFLDTYDHRLAFDKTVLSMMKLSKLAYRYDCNATHGA